MGEYVGIDIGGTAIKYGSIDETGQLLDHDKMPTEAHLGGPSILKKTIGIVENSLKTKDIKGICISTAGMVDTKEGSIFYSAPLIPNYAGTQFKKTLEEKFHIPCEVENDVNCAGLAESISGAAKDCDIVLCLTVGTGIGGCIVMDKKVYHGFSNSACEVGYLPMLDSDFQTLGSTKTLCERVAVAKAKEGDKSKWGGRRIFEAAQKGDWVCLREIDRMTEALGRGIATICYVVNPEIVVLGGGVMAQKDYLYPKIRKAMDTYLVSGISKKTKVRMASYENHAGMIGAFYHFKTLHPGEGGGCVWKAT